MTFTAYSSLFPRTVFQFTRHRNNGNAALQHSRIMTPTLQLLDTTRQSPNHSKTVENGWSHVTSSVWYIKYKRVKRVLDAEQKVQTNAARFDAIDVHNSIKSRLVAVNKHHSVGRDLFLAARQLFWRKLCQEVPALQAVATSDAERWLHPIEYATASRIAVLRMSRLSREVFGMAWQQNRAMAQSLDLAHEAFCMKLSQLAVGTSDPQLYENFETRIEAVVRRGHPSLFDSRQNLLVRDALLAENELQLRALRENRMKYLASHRWTICMRRTSLYRNMTLKSCAYRKW